MTQEHNAVECSSARLLRRKGWALDVAVQDNARITLGTSGFDGHSKLAWITLCLILGYGPVALAQNADSLKAHYSALREQLDSNQFQRPIYLESSEQKETIKGDIYALIQQPYAVVAPALQNIGHWCDILILHLNVKRCIASTPMAGKTLSINIGRKSGQPLSDTYLFEFNYNEVEKTSDYLQLELNAEKGPLSTSRYRIALELTGIDVQHSFLHMSYSYSYGTAARVAMLGYLGTIGRDKVGFSIAQANATGQRNHIGGMRGVIERNTMRYYLAVESYIGALSTPMPERIEKRLNDWYDGVERYPAQLHELERGEYLDMKHSELLRQQVPVSSAQGR